MKFHTRVVASFLLFLALVYLFMRPSNDEDDLIISVPNLPESEISLRALRQLYLPDFPGSYVTPEKSDAIESKRYPPIKRLPFSKQMRILVTGGAGFVGSHLVDRLMLLGHQVIVVDNLFTGRKRNIQHWIGHPNFEFFDHDVTDPIYLQVHQIYHLASPASPPHYQYNPIKTLKTNLVGTVNMLGLARRVKARILIASTSEIYGDPKENPQNEEYWGHVNPIGPRACYDEGKRVSETLAYSYLKQENVDIRVARIFNTYGPRMLQNDGRVVSNFIVQALKGSNLTIYGDGTQTRSFQLVHDLVNGLIALMSSHTVQPVNLGNPDEYSIEDFALLIRKEVNPNVKVIHLKSAVDDPTQRKPDINRAKKELKWSPVFPIHFGIKETVDYFRSELLLYGE